jgi:hypothetical protein
MKHTVLKVACMFQGKMYAVKKVRISQTEVDEVSREVAALAELTNDYIVRYYDSWTEDSKRGKNHDL